MKSITAAFKTTGHETMSRDELIAQGAKSRDIDRAVASGKLRTGTSRYFWLPRAADPGALFVMRAAMNDSHDDENN